MEPIIDPADYETDIEAGEVAQQAQRLYALADLLVARAERIRDSAERLVASAHVDLAYAQRVSQN